MSLNPAYFFNLIYEIIAGNWWHTLRDVLIAQLPLIRTISYTLSFVLFGAVVYAAVRLHQVRSGDEKKWREITRVLATTDSELKNERWERILTLVESQNPNDWRIAIMESDTILDELITHMGYHGEDMGEKLKRIEKSDFATLEQAWEGHKIRNRIAHSGSDFVLTQRETQRVIDLYRQVFTEFHFI